MKRDSGLVHRELEAVIAHAYRLSEDVGGLVEDILREGKERPLSSDEAFRLLSRVIIELRNGAQRRGDKKTTRALAGDIEQLVKRIMRVRDRVSGAGGSIQTLVSPNNGIKLVEMHGVKPQFVQPHGVFQGRVIPMESGFVRTTDIPLWEGNLRLEIHLAQFREKFGRKPSREELLDIMLSRMSLPGIPEKDKADQFRIVGLARSIATNGVRQPPILDKDGTLLDGNRRVAACYYILNSDEFELEQKKRAEYIFVRKLTEHATKEDRNAVVVSLNFEQSHTQEWPDYIRARIISQDWEEMLSLEPRSPSPKRMNELKRQLSIKYALGPETSVVSRYIKMVEWADQFEDYHVNIRGRDQHEVTHRSNKYFQFFDELSRGAQNRGVAYFLQSDDTFQHLIFDLLFDGKFTEWHQIRPLKYAYENEDARQALARAHEASDIDEARDHLENALTIARMQHADRRELGAKTRIEVFVDWLEQVPLRAFDDGSISPEYLDRLIKNIEKLVRILERLKKMTKPLKIKAGSH